MFIRVFELPGFIRPNYRFGGGMPMPFTEVDWFRDDDGLIKTDAGRADYIAFIKNKRYYKASHGYLLLHPTHSLTINLTESMLLGHTV